MKVSFEATITRRGFCVTDEHPTSSYGIPVAVVAGSAYGQTDYLPIWMDDNPELFLNCMVPIARDTVRSIASTTKLTDAQFRFCQKFWA